MNHTTVVGMGEALWDMLPEGKKIGGAPANFAYHVSQFGLDSYVVSAVGEDELGTEILSNFREKKLGCMIERVPYPTGTVQVQLDSNGVPCYDIREGVAWDNIPFTPALESLARQTCAVCFGSLAQRSVVSCETINRFLDAMPGGEDRYKIFDINLRQGFYTKEILCNSMRKCNILKINDDEIDLICSVIGLDTCDGSSLFSWLSENTAIHTLLLTRGKHGSDCFTLDGGKIHEECSSVHVVDTVGAGDSLSAAFLFFRYEKKLSVSEALQKATAVADFVVGHKGAIPLYDRTMFSD